MAVPADILRQRPDIRRAERQLAAQTANIGVATAALYPDFSLTGFLGLQSRSVSDLFTGNAEMWGISAPMQWNLFNGGQVRSNIRVQEALAEQTLLNYQQTILKAIEEVENSLQAYDQESQRASILKGAVVASREASRLAMVQYNNGLTEFNNVMTMQRYLFQLEDQLAASEAQSVINLIALYKAMGGGW
jgi:NodT family efflux transporter outer membrane factor (OMF) lipoprotein